MLRRRLRGILRTTVATSIPWTAIGLLTGLVFRLGLIPDVYVELGSPFPGGLVAAFTAAGAIVGVINGLTLAGIVLATERGKKIEDLRMWRFATWGAVATAGTLGLFFESLPRQASAACLARAPELPRFRPLVTRSRSRRRKRTPTAQSADKVGPKPLRVIVVNVM